MILSDAAAADGVGDGFCAHTHTPPQQQQQQQHICVVRGCTHAAAEDAAVVSASSSDSDDQSDRDRYDEHWYGATREYIGNISDLCMQSDEGALEEICTAHGVRFACAVAKLAVRMHAFAADESIFLAYRRICRERDVAEWNRRMYGENDRELEARAAAVVARVAAEDARTAFLVAFFNSAPGLGGPTWEQTFWGQRRHREPLHPYYVRILRKFVKYMEKLQQHFDRLQPQMREALVAADAEYDALSAQQVRLTQQLVALQTQSTISKAQLSGAKRELAYLLSLFGRAPSSHVDSAVKDQRNRITELTTKLAQDDTEEAEALNAKLARLRRRMLHLRLRRASLQEYTMQRADAFK